ncbi:MAG: methyl-accepting chemotaxis protein [Tumebacillaceae bacterium]
MTIGAISYQTAKTKVGDEMLQGAQTNVQILNQSIDQIIGGKMQDVDLLAQSITDDSVPASKGGAAEPSVQMQLNQFEGLHPEFKQTYLVSEDGNVRNSPPRSQNGDVRQQPWYQQAIQKKGSVIIAGPFTTKEGELVLSIARTTPEGKSVVGVDLPLQKIQDIISQAKIGRTGYAYILDKSGMFVVHPTEKPGSDAKKYDFVANLYKGDSGQFSYTYNGADKQLAFVTNKTTGWKIAGSLYTSEIASEANSIFNKTLLVVGVWFVVGGALVALIIRSITLPLRRMIKASQIITDGDLSQRIEVKSDDELGKLAASFNAMVESMRNVIFEVTDSASQLSSASQELTAGAQQSGAAAEHSTFIIQELADGADQQVRSVEDAKQSVMQMSAGAEQIAASAQSVSMMATQASVVADEGNQAIQKAVQQMNFISTSVNGSAASIIELGDHASHIGEIVETITGIASQTNLLALNAAIEAARAGEHGRGFAVVADEVRKLAEQSSRSAQEIAAYITTIQAGIEKAVKAMQDGTREVSTGIDVVNVAGESFAQIQESVHEVAIQIQGVSAAVQQMSAGTEQVVKSIEEINDVTEQASSAMQNVSASTEEQLASMEEITFSASVLSDLAEQMEHQVKRFKI